MSTFRHRTHPTLCKIPMPMHRFSRRPTCFRGRRRHHQGSGSSHLQNDIRGRDFQSRWRRPGELDSFVFRDSFLQHQPADQFLEVHFRWDKIDRDDPRFQGGVSTRPLHVVCAEQGEGSFHRQDHQHSVNSPRRIDSQVFGIRFLPIVERRVVVFFNVNLRPFLVGLIAATAILHGAGPIRAQVTEVVVGITPHCPYGFPGCWAGTRKPWRTWMTC